MWFITMQKLQGNINKKPEFGIAILLNNDENNNDYQNKATFSN